MIFRCDCVWVREGGVLRERYTDVCALCVCVCVWTCKELEWDVYQSVN